MQLFEAIVDANQRAARGEEAGLHPEDFPGALPIVALTCIDPRLNPILPGALGLPEEHFIWLRNAGNIITGPVSSTMRSIALACAVKDGKEIVIIGHTDCGVRKTSGSELIDRFRALGIDRTKLPENVQEFFGLFASERSNVLRAVEFTRQSPLISPRVPVHGLLVDTFSGKLEWLVNGYTALQPGHAPAAPENFNLAPFQMGEMKFPDMKIGETPAMPAPIPAPVRPPAKAAPQPQLQPPQVIPMPPRLTRGRPPRQS